jgi:hypothetical protein
MPDLRPDPEPFMSRPHVRRTTGAALTLGTAAAALVLGAPAASAAALPAPTLSTTTVPANEATPT